MFPATAGMVPHSAHLTLSLSVYLWLLVMFTIPLTVVTLSGTSDNLTVNTVAHTGYRTAEQAKASSADQINTHNTENLNPNDYGESDSADNSERHVSRGARDVSDDDGSNQVRHSRNGRGWTKRRMVRSGSDQFQFRRDTPSASAHYHLGAALPFNDTYEFSRQKVWGAGEMAIEWVEERGILPMNSLNISYRDTKCDEARGMNEAINFIVIDKVSAFLGLVCDFSVAPVARQVTFWNIPLVSVGAMARDFLDRRHEVYPQLTRASPLDLNSLAQAFFHMGKAYNWSSIKVLYHREGEDTVPAGCFLVTDALVRGLRPLGMDVDYFELNPGVPLDRLLLDEVGHTYGIVVLCASPDSVREIMIKAAELHFDNGEYVFFNIDLFSSKVKSEQPWYREEDTKENNDLARRAYDALMTVTLRKPDSLEYKKFSEEVKRRAQEEYGNFTYGEEEVNSFVGAFHDAVILYALALNETLAAGIDATNGSEITKRMWNRTFEGITGTVSIDENGDRNADYSLLDLNPDTNTFEVVANYYGNRKKYEPVNDIHWAGNRKSPPPDTPKCGFDGSGCPPDEPFPEYAIVIIVLGSLLIIVSLAAFFIYRHDRLERELRLLNWTVQWEDIMFGAMEKKLERSGSRMSLNRKQSYTSGISGDTIAVHLSELGNKQIYTKTGYHKGTLVAIKKINKSVINVTRPLLMEVKRMRDLQNDHIARFIGSCIEPPNQCILTEYCQKGSLQDILENDQIKLDSMFKSSLMQDIVRGMAYLHSGEIRSHGNLKSSNCVVDSRFVLKITDFALHSLRGRDTAVEENTYAYYRSKLWTGPELLRMHNAPLEGTQKGDVYSFAIICEEILYRAGPFYVRNMDLSPQEIYTKVKNGLQPYFRPTIDDSDVCSEALANIIKRCWAEEPMERPDFHALKTMYRKATACEGDSGNILDNLLQRMEQYANNLETLVEERTADYLEQKKRAEDLLYMMLPKSVAHQLMLGETVAAEKYEGVTIYFSDICGFTALSADSTPMQVIDLLNDLYTTFDSIIESFDVYKVETIGDAYMVVSGLPHRNGNLHAREISRMSLAILNAVRSFKIRHLPSQQLRIRIGLHSGAVCAGVVGHKMPRYCLFGDTVNTSSRMESNGLPLKIHLSPQTKELLDTFGTFKVELRGPVEMKGKGTVITWWLCGESNNHENPDFAPLDSTD